MDSCNLRVRAWMRSPVVTDEWLPLDGILLYQHARADLGGMDITLSGASAREQPKGAPMKGGKIPVSTIHAKDWYYKCSWAQWGPYADGQDAWNKRFDSSLAALVDFKGRRGKIDISSGATKAYHMPIFYRSALWIDWYLVGDADKVGELLLCATHIGKKTSQGWGRVAKWDVECIDDDWSIWKDGRLMRGIPVYHLPREKSHLRKIGQYGIRPPYYDRRNQIDLVVP